MKTSMTTLRTLSIVLISALLALASTGCDGGVDDMATTTHALQAELDASSPAMSYDLQVRVFAPKAHAVERFKAAQLEQLPAATLEAGLDIITHAANPVDMQRLKETFSATVAALANSEVVAEREVQDAADQPFFTNVPLTACGGRFPCDIFIRVDLEGYDLEVSGALDVSGAAWVASEYFDVEIVNVDAFPTY